MDSKMEFMVERIILFIYTRHHVLHFYLEFKSKKDSIDLQTLIQGPLQQKATKFFYEFDFPLRLFRKLFISRSSKCNEETNFLKSSCHCSTRQRQWQSFLKLSTGVEYRINAIGVKSTLHLSAYDFNLDFPILCLIQQQHPLLSIKRSSTYDGDWNAKTRFCCFAWEESKNVEYYWQ